MKQFTRLVVGLMLALIWNACDHELDFVPAQPQDLSFSRDTVYLDTVFTNIGSATYNLRVYNRSSENVLIERVRLGQGSDSKFRLNVDGLSGQEFEDVELLAKDSMYVFVETTVDIQDYTQEAKEFLYEDKLFFNNQSVDLVTLVKDAIFLYPEIDDQGIKEFIPIGEDEDGNPIGIEGFYLDDDELIFTNDLPYVIYGYAGVPAGKTAVFEAGARVHFHENSGLIAAQESSVHVLGAPSFDAEKLENEVVFEGDRLEPFFENIPGQWGTLWLTQGSTNHIFRHATIKNATVGILMDYNDGGDEATLLLEQTQIHNSSSVGLWAKTAHIEAKNSIFGNAGNLSFYGNYGGQYDFTHCTFANYWNRSFRNTPAVALDDFIQISETEILVEPLEKADFNNCIIDGNQRVEFLVSQEGENPLNFTLNHTSIRFDTMDQSILSNPYFDFDDNSHYNTLFQNIKTSLRNPQQNDFRPTQDSEVINMGDKSVAEGLSIDIIGINRTEAPDLGAYQHQVFEED
jgi:hypothetical protein